VQRAARGNRHSAEKSATPTQKHQTITTITISPPHHTTKTTSEHQRVKPLLQSACLPACLAAQCLSPLVHEQAACIGQVGGMRTLTPFIVISAQPHRSPAIQEITPVAIHLSAAASAAVAPKHRPASQPTSQQAAALFEQRISQ